MCFARLVFVVHTRPNVSASCLLSISVHIILVPLQFFYRGHLHQTSYMESSILRRLHEYTLAFYQ